MIARELVDDSVVTHVFLCPGELVDEVSVWEFKGDTSNRSRSGPDRRALYLSLRMSVHIHGVVLSPSKPYGHGFEPAIIYTREGNMLF